MGNRRGQAMIEAIVALSALVIAFVGVYGLLSTSLRYNRFVANDYTATYLAAEGIEVVKNLLDSNIIAGRSWDCGFMNGTYELTYDTQFTDTGGGTADCLQSVLTPVSTNPRNLYLDPTSHLYNYNVPVSGTFVRTVTATILKSDALGNPQEIQVNSRVSWGQGTGSRNINLEDRFFNWHP